MINLEKYLPKTTARASKNYENVHLLAEAYHVNFTFTDCYDKISKIVYNEIYKNIGHTFQETIKNLESLDKELYTGYIYDYENNVVINNANVNERHYKIYIILKNEADTIMHVYYETDKICIHVTPLNIFNELFNNTLFNVFLDASLNEQEIILNIKKILAHEFNHIIHLYNDHKHSITEVNKKDKLYKMIINDGSIQENDKEQIYYFLKELSSYEIEANIQEYYEHVKSLCVSKKLTVQFTSEKEFVRQVYIDSYKTTSLYWLINEYDSIIKKSRNYNNILINIYNIIYKTKYNTILSILKAYENCLKAQVWRIYIEETTDKKINEDVLLLVTTNILSKIVN